MKTYNHLSYEDRKNIEDGLNDNKSINQIAKELNQLTGQLIKNMKIIIIIFTVLNLINLLMCAMDVNPEVDVEKKDLLTTLEKQMILIEN